MTSSLLAQWLCDMRLLRTFCELDLFFSIVCHDLCSSGARILQESKLSQKREEERRVGACRLPCAVCSVQYRILTLMLYLMFDWGDCSNGDCSTLGTVRLGVDGLTADSSTVRLCSI